MYDCVIIGAGPAGVSAAIYTARADLSTLVLGNPATGHLYTSHIIANYFGFPEDITGPDLMLRGIEQAKRFGAAFRENEVVELRKEGDLFKVMIDTQETFEAKTIIIATGMTYKSSGIPGEKALVGKGLSYCVTCDGPFFRNKRVFVIGSGSFAAEEAVGLHTFTPDVTIVNQHSTWNITDELDKALIHYNIPKQDRKIVKLLTNESGFINEVQFDDDTKEFADGIFIAVGTAGPTSFSKMLGLDMTGQFIKVGPSGQTSMEHVYAVGNCTGANAQVATSVGMGCDAAVDIIRKIRGQRVYVDYN